MASKDLYSVLGLQHGASIDEVRKTFKKLAVQYHPDLQQGKSEAEKKQAEEKFKEINEAYSVLSDPKKKQEYDNFGSYGGGGMDMGGDGFADMADFIRNMHASSGFSGFDPFGGGFGGGRPIVKGKDVRIKVDCTIEDIYNSVNKTVRYTRMVKCGECNGNGSKNGESATCPHCNGTGMITETRRLSAFQVIQSTTTCPHCQGTGTFIKNPCHKCHGTGLEESKETVSINIPIEIRDGMVVVMDGMGDMAPNNMGEPGKLLIKFNVQEHPTFKIAENNVDLECKVKVNVFDCITGCDKTVNTINGGKMNIKVPAGAKDKQRIVIRGNGMPVGNGSYGDMVVVVEQVMPTKLSKDDVKKITELKDSLKF